jgi:hypothetical protein
MCNPYNKLSNKANVSSLNPFSCKIQIFKVRVKVSYLLRNFEKLQRFFTGEPCHSGHEHGVRRFFFFSGVSFHLRRCPQGVASVLCKKTPILGSRRSKLDHLTVSKPSRFKFVEFFHLPTTRHFALTVFMVLTIEISRG